MEKIHAFLHILTLEFNKDEVNSWELVFLSGIGFKYADIGAKCFTFELNPDKFISSCPLRPGNNHCAVVLVLASVCCITGFKLLSKHSSFK